MADKWRFNARYLYGDMADMETLIEESGLEYILLRPGFMVEDPARHDLQFAVGGGTPKQRTITYEDFAEFILDQVDSDEYLNKAVGMYSDVIMDPAAEIRKYQEKMRQQQEQQWQQQQYQQQQYQQQQYDQQIQAMSQNFYRAYAACMSARQYQVQ